MIKKLIEIEGLHCENCAKKVKDALYGLPEVEDVEVNLSDKNAKVTLKFAILLILEYNIFGFKI